MSLAGSLYRNTMSALQRLLPPGAGRGAGALVAGLTAAQYGIDALRIRPGPTRPLVGEASAWLEEVRRAGFCIVPGFLDPAACARWVAEIDRLLAEHPESVHHNTDERVLGVEAQSAELRRFAEDERLLGMAEAMFGEPTVDAFTMAARMDHTGRNEGSGEGWHRDSFVVQFKAIIYLSDVDETNGPFQIVAGSERLRAIARDSVRARLGFQQNRLSEPEVDRVVAADPSRLRTVTGSAGTLLLADTSAIHRGCPIDAGCRYALTNYYFPTRRAGPELAEHFAPILPGHPLAGVDAGGA